MPSFICQPSYVSQNTKSKSTFTGPGTLPVSIGIGNGSVNVIILFLVLFVHSACFHVSEGNSQNLLNITGDSPAGYVSESFLSGHLHVLAHDSLEGRGTGQEGARKAADYIHDFYHSETFSSIGDMEVIRQPFTLEGRFWDAVTYGLFQIDEEDTLYQSQKTMTKGSVSSFYPLMDGTDEVEGPVVFAGFGPVDRNVRELVSRSDEMQDAWVMIFEDNADPPPGNTSYGISRSDLVRKISGYYGAAGVIFIPDSAPEVWEEKAADMSRQLERPLAIRKQGSVGFRNVMSSGGLAVSVHPEKAMNMLGLSELSELDSLRTYWSEADTRGEPVNTGFRLKNSPDINYRSFQEENVVTVIPGADEEYRDEVIVLSAHYDHMGLGEPDDRDDIVYNGADDNASGTAVLMQIAEVFGKASGNGYRPSRTLVFLHAAAEEWGLIGSRYYVRNPIHPRDHIIANVNIDMVGFIDDKYADEEHTDYIYIIGAGLLSSTLGSILDQANHASSNLILDQKYNDTGHHMRLYRRSDQWAFAEQGIPFVFFFSGLHDYYHKPSDTVDRIDYALLTSRSRFVTEFVWRLAESPERPAVDRQEWIQQRQHTR